MVYAQPRIRHGKCFLEFWVTNGSFILGQTMRPSDSQQKKKGTCRIVNFDHRAKLKEREKRDKYLDLVREQKKLWNMKVTVIPIVIGALGTVTKGPEQGLEDLEIRGSVATIQATALLRLPRIWKSPGDVRRHAVTQTPVENHQLTLVWKILKRRRRRRRRKCDVFSKVQTNWKCFLTGLNRNLSIDSNLDINSKYHYQ